MRQMIKGLLAALAVTAAGVAPAAACGYGGCCAGFVSPCATTYAPVYTHHYSGCGTCNTGWAYERLAEPETQYYYVNQGPTYSGPGAFAPYPTYHEDALPTWGYHRHHHRWHHVGYAPTHYYHGHPLVRRYY